MRYLLLLICLAATAQKFNAPTTTFKGNVDASTALSTRSVKVGTLAAIPATCTQGALYFATDGSKSRQLQLCSATDTWITVGYQSGVAHPVACATGELFFDTDAAAGSNLELCTATNTWTAISGGSGSGTATAVYSGTLDFGAIPDFGCSELTYTATGVSTGANLAVAWPASLEAGLIPSARASAANTIAVRVCNSSGAAVNPANITYSVRDVGSLGYLSGSGVIDFAIIPDGGCISATMAVTGAVVGDRLATGWPAGLEAGLHPSARITGAGVVTISLCNFSGAAVNPASATFTTAVTK